MSAYCTLDDVRRETKNSSANLDSLYEACIAQATNWIDQYCGRSWQTQDYDEDAPYTLSPTAVLGDELFLPWEPRGENALQVFLEDTELEVSFVAGRRVVLASALAYPFTAQLTIRGSGGYSVSEIPAPIRRAAVLIAAVFSSEKRIEQIGFDGSRTTLIDTRIPQEVKDLLKRYIVRGDRTL